MSDGDRGKRPAYLRGDLLAITILSVYLLVGALAFYSGRQDERRTYEPHQHAISAADAAQERCFGREGGALTECVIEQIAAAEETSRAEQDLQAQQHMALWALLMMLVSAATVGVTIWALVYIKETLDETKRMANEAGIATKAAVAAAEAGREANEIARETRATGQRAWMGSREPTVIVILDHDDIAHELDIRIEWENFGSSPALNVFAAAIKLKIERRAVSYEDFIPEIHDAGGNAAAIFPGIGTGTVLRLSKEEYERARTTGKPIIFYSKVFYNDLYSDIRRWSEATIRLMPDAVFADITTDEDQKSFHWVSYGTRNTVT